MLEKLTAAQRRYNENAVLIAALGLIYKKLSEKYKSKQLAELAETTSGGTPLRNISAYYGGDIPWVKSGELNDGIISDVGEFITQDGIKNSSAKIFPKGTLVVALYGATVGKTGILGLDAASNQAVCAIFPKSDFITTEFLFWYLRYKRPEFLASSFGGAQPNISQKLLRITEVPVPPKSLQKSISTFLTVVERRQNGDRSIDLPLLSNELAEIHPIVARIEALAVRIAEAQKLTRETIEHANAIFKSELAQIFNVKQPKYPLYRLDEVAERIEDIPHLMPRAVDDGKILVSPKDFTKYGINFVNCKRISDEDFQRLARKIRPKRNDILFSRIGTIGEARLVDTDEDFIASYSIVTIRANLSLLIPKFLLYVLQSPSVLDQAKKGVRAIAMPDLGVKTIKSFQVPVPSLDEQRRLVAHLNGLQAQVSELRALQSESAQGLNALMPSVLDRAFNGEL